MSYTIYGKHAGSNEWQWLVLGIPSFDDCLHELKLLNEENSGRSVYWSEFKIVIE